VKKENHQCSLLGAVGGRKSRILGGAKKKGGGNRLEKKVAKVFLIPYLITTLNSDWKTPGHVTKMEGKQYFSRGKNEGGEGGGMRLKGGRGMERRKEEKRSHLLERNSLRDRVTMNASAVPLRNRGGFVGVNSTQ